MDYNNKSARDLGYQNNKDVKFKYVSSIYLKKFRSLENRTIKIGKYFTLITGKNGTMKSSLLGLIAHPFSSQNDAKDLYGNDLKTDMRNVFKMSIEKDSTPYKYYLNATTIEDIDIFEPIRMYPRPKENRHRITVGKDNSAGLGNFSLNTSYMNLKRLFPIIDTEAKDIPDNLSDRERHWITQAYNIIMQRDAFAEFETISDKKSKYTCGPKNSFYDYNSISSGEDNLGSILYKMVAFKQNKTSDDCLQGIFCIDELEASLHPVAQERLFNFLYDWARKNHIQIIATTHSLYLVNHFLDKQQQLTNGTDECILINVSTQQVGSDNNYKIMTNPNYKSIYKELTYKNIDDLGLYKVNILCEDTIAKNVIQKILHTRTILNNVDFITDISGGIGTSCNSLKALVKNGKKLLIDSVVIVDPDVPLDRINYDFLIKIPDCNNYPIEKRIAYYINSLDGADSLFAEKEKSAHQANMADCHIDFTRISIDKNITPYKEWRNSNKNFFNKALTRYIRENQTFFSEFRNNVIDMINKRRHQNGLPPIEK